MRRKIRLLSFLLVLVLLTLMLPTGMTSAADGDASYTKNKVVSVLFDNSGSMKDDGGTVYRWEYAKYALQTLMTTLGKNDTLVITPMNEGYSAVSSTSSGVVVDLAAENREAEIDRVLKETFLGGNPGYTTPESTIQVAVKQLTERGMKKTSEIAADEESENEYFLVVLTDGVFNGCSSSSLSTQGKIDKAATYFETDLSKYASFQSIYIGFDTNALDLSAAASLQGKANFAAYKAATTADIGGVMESVANRITGRYPLAVNADPNSTVVRIPLDSVGFSLRTVTVMVTNSNARFASATYNGSNVAPSQYAGFDGFESSDKAVSMMGGFTAVLSRGSTSSTFSGGEIVLTLDEAPGAGATVSVLLEPALVLSPIIEADVGGTRKQVDAAYINGNMKKGDTVYLSYQLLEQGTGRVIDPSAIGGNASARVTYNTKSYAPHEAITLVEGKKEVGISVSMMDGQYTLYASFPCVVLENPSFFRIETSDVVVKSKTTFETVFTVYSNNLPISSLAELNAFSPTVVAKDEAGNPLAVSVSKNANGTMTVTLDVTGREYGTYTITASVKDADGNPRSLAVPIGYYPEGLTLTLDGTDRIATTLYGIGQNTAGFSFVLSAQDTPIPFENALLKYTLTVGGTDLTAHATVEGNRLTFVPTPETLGAIAGQTGDHAVKLVAVFHGAKTERVESAATLSLSNTVFTVEPLSPTGSVDRFALKNNQSSAVFRVLRDGISLSAEELQAALDDGSLAVGIKVNGFLHPVRFEPTVETVGGTPAIRVRIAAGHFGLLRGLVTSMFVMGESIEVNVGYSGVSAVSLVPLASASIVSYIWRILLILYIIQLIILIVTFKSVKRVPKGTLVKVTLEGEGDEKTVTKGEIIKHVRTKDTLLPVRLLPFVGLIFREKTVKTADNYVQVLRSNGAGVGVEITPYNTGKFTEFDSNKAITSVAKQKYKENTTDGNLGRLKEKGITVAVKTEAKKQSGIIPLNEKEGYVTNPGGRKASLYLFIRP